MIIMTLISLYTAKVMLNVLGFEDYGIYQIVGSIVVLFSFLNKGLSAASSRFITAEIATNNVENGNRTFNVCLQAHFIIAFIIFIIAETIGLWIVNCVLKIPEGRMFAVNVIYQFSIINTIVNILCSPFNTTITSYERMNIYAYLAIFDSVMKLAIVFVIQVIDSDKLIFYALLLLIVSILHAFLNNIYCYKNFPICHIKKVWDKSLLKSIFKFTSWSLLGQSCIVGTNQGVNVLINYFCGVTVNAAVGVSNQVMSVVTQLISNFQMAFRPQIVKSYVNNETVYLQSLITRASKISSCLMLFSITPILLLLPNILHLWLGNYPDYTIEFVRWTLIALFFDSITGPLWMTINSQTNIKSYQIWTSLFFSMNFFIGWLILWPGIFPPYSVMIVRVFVFIALIGVRLYFTKKHFKDFSIKEWVFNVLLKSIFMFILSYGSLYLLQQQISLSIWQELILIILLSELILITLSYMILMSENERLFVKNIIKTKILKR